MKITLIGGANRIGASCALVQTHGISLLIDCGNDVPDGLSEAELTRAPEIDVRDLLSKEEIHLVLITHGHTDHVGKLLEVWKDHPSMRVMMTQPTLETARIILQDGIKIRYKDPFGDIPIENQDLVAQEILAMNELLNRVEIIPRPGLYRSFPHPSIDLWLFPASHIRGAMTILIQTKEWLKTKSVLFTGDFGLEDKETVRAAPLVPEYSGVDLLFCDSTNGATVLQPRQERYAMLDALVSQTISQGGNVLIPAFAIERSVEIVLHLIQSGFHVYLDGLGNKFLQLYSSPLGTWCENDHMLDEDDPRWWNFHRVKSFLPFLQRTHREVILERKRPWIVVATSATLSGGPVLEYAMRILENEKSTIIFPCHVFEGTPAYTLLNQEGEPITLITKLHPDGKPLIPRCQVAQIRLSAHMDQEGILRLVETIKPKQVAPVHCGGKDAQDALEDLLRAKFSFVRTFNGIEMHI